LRSNDEIINLVNKLREEQRISLSELARRVEMAKSGLSRIFNKTRGFPVNRAEDFANALGVSVEYLLGFDSDDGTKRSSSKTKKDPTTLTPKDEKSIQAELERLIEGMNSGAYAAFDGQTLDDMDEEDRELLIASLENSLRVAKKLAKEKFTPKKYR